MMRTILIPTDFSIESLNLFKVAAQSGITERVHIIFFHCVSLSTSIVDLLFLSQRKMNESLINENFSNGCTIIRNKFPSSISTDRIEFFSGITQSSFQNFLEGNGVTEIFIPKNYTLKKTSHRSFDPMPFIRQSNLLKQEIYWKNADRIPEKNMLAELFSDPVISIQ